MIKKRLEFLLLKHSVNEADDKLALDKFNKKVAELTRAISGADVYRKWLDEKIKYFKIAVIDGAEVPDDSYNY